MRKNYKNNIYIQVLLVLPRMKTTQITVKEVNEKAFQELKATAIKGKMTVWTALTLAIENWLSSLKEKKGIFSELKPRNWGHGTERLSEEIDKIIYGE